MAHAVRNKILLVSAIAGIGLGMYAVATAGEYGPLVCLECTVAAPYPDPNTQAFLDNQTDWNLWPWPAGDIYHVCNGEYCTSYRVTTSGQYYGYDRKRMEGFERYGRTREGGSGSVGGSGGGMVGSGGMGIPTVTVGDPEKADK